MARCIYVPERELNDDRPPNERTKSIEHVVPWALGGSNGCTVDDVSTKANNDLGTEIDAPFSNLLPIASWRQYPEAGRAIGHHTSDRVRRGGDQGRNAGRDYVSRRRPGRIQAEATRAAGS